MTGHSITRVGFFTSRGVGWSSDIWTSRTTLERLLQNKYLMLDVLNHKCNALITTAADGSIS